MLLRTRMKQSVSVCLGARAQFFCLCKRKKKEEPASQLSLVYLLVFAFVYILEWAAIFNKGLGVGEEAEGMSKHVPEPK